MVRFINAIVTCMSDARSRSEGKYMLIVKGENRAAKATSVTISHFCRFAKTEYTGSVTEDVVRETPSTDSVAEGSAVVVGGAINPGKLMFVR
jgi:hypothetical protein